MIESEWLASDDPVAMLAQFIPPGGRSSRTGHKLNSFPTTDRKLRLFAVACCRQVWYLLTDECSRRAVEVAERYADGLATAEELDRAALGVAGVPGRTNAPLWCCAFSADFVLRNVPRACGVPPTAQAALLRCVFGNPFRPPPAVDPAWLWANDRAAGLVAEGIYEDRAFEHLPILADALEEAGCTDAALLGHLRGRERCPCLGRRRSVKLFSEPPPSPVGELVCGVCDGEGWVDSPALHARGCWALDLLLGKE
jgi:hypothetical protein